MKNFKQGGGGFKSGGFGGGRDRGGDRFSKPSFGRPQFGGRDDRGDRGGRGDSGTRMFEATCSECRKQCEVPFFPNGQKPVYCKDCFANQGGRGGAPSYGGAPKREFAQEDRAPRPAQDSRIDDIKKQLDIVNTKLDQALKVLMQTSISHVKTAVPEFQPEVKSNATSKTVEKIKGNMKSKTPVSKKSKVSKK